jgi:hypothetical protein
MLRVKTNKMRIISKIAQNVNYKLIICKINKKKIKIMMSLIPIEILNRWYQK